MLDVLFGGQNMKKVLIFLFVNGKCYGTQLHKSLKTPLTPIQKALSRLEKSGVILSFYEGKTRLYQFNPNCPLLPELEALLKKVYTLLSPEEKKQYCYIRPDSPHKSHIQSENAQVLHSFWERLSKVRGLTFHAKTKSTEKNGWNGRGKGEVLVSNPNDSILIFNEKGSWKNSDENETDFSNVFRWTFDRSAGIISLEHLRRGLNHPVFLFHLTPTGNHSLASIDSHLCGGDAYFGQVLWDKQNLRLNWRVIGPKKNEEIDYYYLT
jgi:hypothetical protein